MFVDIVVINFGPVVKENDFLDKGIDNKFRLLLYDMRQIFHYLFACELGLGGILFR